MQRTKAALVVGANGGIGGEMVVVLRRHGWRVRALARRPGPVLDGVEQVTGDAMRAEDLMAAADGIDVLVHAVNPPGYRDWDRLVLPMLDNSIEAALAHGARLVLPGTIYNYGADAFPLLGETSPQHPRTRKGAIRVRMEQRLAAAAARGLRSLVLRAGDFFGRASGNSWFSQALLGRHAIVYPGRRDVGHAWAYLPDLAEAAIQLLQHEARLAPFETFHFGGHWDVDGRQMIDAIRAALGRRRFAVLPFPWAALGLLAPFNATAHEMREMRYLWSQPVRLDNRRLVALLGCEPHTPLDAAVAAAIDQARADRCQPSPASIS